MLDTYYFKNKNEAVKMLKESQSELTDWFFNDKEIN